ncbi:MAG: citrate synthase [Cellvibrionaceae bacterium]
MESDIEDSPSFVSVKKRKEEFVAKASTKIWKEIPSKENPYICESALCHGYDLIELMKKSSFIHVLYLMFRGELPCENNKELLERAMIAFINPGPRNSATRAAMDAGIGKTDAGLILPIGLNILSGNFRGAAEVELSMRWLRKHRKFSPKGLVAELLEKSTKEEEASEEDLTIAPGFGSHFGSIDKLTLNIADSLIGLSGSGDILLWGNEFAKELNLNNMGWLNTGVVAAVLCDLGFQPRMGAGLFQIMSAPGLYAHGIELASKPITAMPFPDDDHYFIEKLEENKNVE